GGLFNRQEICLLTRFRPSGGSVLASGLECKADLPRNDGAICVNSLALANRETISRLAYQLTAAIGPPTAAESYPTTFDQSNQRRSSPEYELCLSADWTVQLVLQPFAIVKNGLASH